MQALRNCSRFQGKQHLQLIDPTLVVVILTKVKINVNFQVCLERVNPALLTS